jgi:drug/metabolite transporter (DMT)-like permease
MPALTRQQLWALVCITVIWGLNWPIMKIGVTDYPPLTFRVISMWLGLPVLALGLLLMKAPLRIARTHWPELLRLTLFNMLIWHALIIVAVKSLSSGRAAILGYSMPVFSALLGAWLFGQHLAPRAWGGVLAALTGVVLLLWNEFSLLAGQPLAVLLALLSAASWAMGVQLMRRTQIPVPTVTLAFWMSVLTTLFISVLALLLERAQWTLPSTTTWAAIAYNAVLIFGLVQALYLSLTRHLTPVASTLSVMMIPVIGVFSGAIWLGEVLRWQDYAAVGLMVLAIATVLWPARSART